MPRKTINVGRVKGSMWYTGTNPQEVQNPLEGDLYLYTKEFKVYRYTNNEWVLTTDFNQINYAEITHNKDESYVENFYNKYGEKPTFVKYNGPSGGNYVLRVSKVLNAYDLYAFDLEGRYKYVSCSASDLIYKAFAEMNFREQVITTDRDQTITGTKTFDARAHFRKGADFNVDTSFGGVVTFYTNASLQVTPKNPQHLVNKEYVDKTISSKADLVDGVIPASQLPSYVDDVIEIEKTVDGKQWKENALATAHGSIVFNNTTASNLEGGKTNKYYRVLLQNVDGTETNLKIIKPEAGKIYVLKTSGVTFRWSGSNLVEISKSLALGETSSTAYAGDKGKANADAIKELQETKADKEALENITTSTPTYSYNLPLGEASWLRIAKVTDIAKNSSGMFTFDCYGVKPDGTREILTTSVFNVSCGLDGSGKFVSDVLPITQAPELTSSDSSGGSGAPSGSGDSGSGTTGAHGLASIKIERFEENVYVCGLLNFPATEQYTSLSVEMKIENNLNFETLKQLEVVNLDEIIYGADQVVSEGTILEANKDYEFKVRCTLADYINGIENEIPNSINISYKEGNGETLIRYENTQGISIGENTFVSLDDMFDSNRLLEREVPSDRENDILSYISYCFCKHYRISKDLFKKLTKVSGKLFINDNGISNGGLTLNGETVLNLNNTDKREYTFENLIVGKDVLAFDNGSAKISSISSVELDYENTEVEFTIPYQDKEETKTISSVSITNNDTYNFSVLLNTLTKHYTSDSFSLFSSYKILEDIPSSINNLDDKVNYINTELSKKLECRYFYTHRYSSKLTAILEMFYQEFLSGTYIYTFSGGCPIKISGPVQGAIWLNEYDTDNYRYLSYNYIDLNTLNKIEFSCWSDEQLPEFEIFQSAGEIENRHIETTADGCILCRGSNLTEAINYLVKKLLNFNHYTTHSTTLSHKGKVNFFHLDEEYDYEYTYENNKYGSTNVQNITISLTRQDLENRKIIKHTSDFTYTFDGDYIDFNDFNEKVGNIGYHTTETPLSPTIDTEMSDTSENPVQNKVVKDYVDNAVANAGGGKLYKHTYTVYFGGDNSVKARLVEYKTTNISETNDEFFNRMYTELTKTSFTRNYFVFDGATDNYINTKIKFYNDYYNSILLNAEWGFTVSGTYQVQKLFEENITDWDTFMSKIRGYKVTIEEV